MFKNTIVLALLSVFLSIEANPHCGKNAWIHWTVKSKSDSKLCGRLGITSGKDAFSLNKNRLYAAFSDCAFESAYCYSTDDESYCCDDIPNYDTAWVGSGNIEFSCSDGPYTCYDFIWQHK
jgi:hypothetical protein